MYFVFVRINIVVEHKIRSRFSIHLLVINFIDFNGVFQRVKNFPEELVGTSIFLVNSQKTQANSFEF